VKRTIKSNTEGLTIEVSDIAGKEKRFLDEFQACQDGRCDCPTDEYEKLDTLEIHDSAGKIGLRLKVKSGRVFDEAEIEKCLDHTERKLDPSG
jgi:hypothetical protein